MLLNSFSVTLFLSSRHVPRHSLCIQYRSRRASERPLGIFTLYVSFRIGVTGKPTLIHVIMIDEITRWTFLVKSLGYKTWVCRASQDQWDDQYDDISENLHGKLKITILHTDYCRDCHAKVLHLQLLIWICRRHWNDYHVTDCCLFVSTSGLPRQWNDNEDQMK